MITPDEIVKKINDRMIQLKDMEKQCIQVLQGKQADLNAIIGAQQDCQYWLSQVTEVALPAFTPDATGGAAVPDTTATSQAPLAPNPLDAANADDVATEDNVNETVN